MSTPACQARFSSRIGCILALGILITPSLALAQESGPELQTKVQQLQVSLDQTREQLQRSQQEIEELRKQLQAIQSRLGTAAPAAPASPDFPTLQNAINAEKTPVSEDVRATQEQQEILAARVEEQAQTKVETASRYKLRLNGLILMNTYSNWGHFDVADLPNLVFPIGTGQPRGDFGATVRQTLLGLEVVGPHVGGAATGADLQADFFGGFPDFDFGVAAGIVRIRTARAWLEWPHTKLLFGQDSPFFSPLSPTSFATLGEPAMSWQGNLWVWTPQIRVEHRWDISDRSSFTLTGGILDALTEQIPPDQFNRAPTPGEASRAPAIAGHAAWNGKWFDHDATIGLGGYFARPNYGFDRNIHSWAVTGDVNLPLQSWLTISGEAFRGRALGGLGGGVWNSIVANGGIGSANTQLIGLGDIGGWAQLKIQPATRWEFNFAAGADNPMSSDLRIFPNPVGMYFPPFARNQSAFVNSIFRPRSNLLLALEYRRLRTYSLNNSKSTGDQVNLAVGISF